MPFKFSTFQSYFAMIVLGSLTMIAISWCSTGHVSGAKLNSDGGYEITFAIQKEHESENSLEYLANVKNTVITFSNQLYRSTNATFFIKRAEILIPSSWSTASVDNVQPATSQSFLTSDFRISDKFQLEPYTENPTLCGSVGNHIELPFGFFEKFNETPFGQQAKVLLTQWARYRWGVWDEHGFPSSTRFPYFHRDTQQGQSEIQNELDEQCSIDREDPLGSDCRFQPSHIGNDATTSLMHFHWLEPITDFCDQSNHNRDAPNKQNLFCGYKSIWEVIRATMDYKAVTAPLDDLIPLTKFQIVKEPGTPVLYVLMDKGGTQYPTLVSKVNNWIARLFDEPTPSTTLAAVGTYPNAVSPKGGRVIERVQWATVGTNKAALQSAVKLPSYDVDSSVRDFGLAIIEAAEIIKRRSPPSGAVLLIVKTGAIENSFGNLAYEKQVYESLSNHGIRVFGLELQGQANKPYLNLGSILGSLNGNHAVVNVSNIDNVALFEGFLSEVRTALSTTISQGNQVKSELFIFNGFLEPGHVEQVFVKPNLTRMNFYLTAPASSQILISVSAGTISEHVVQEWDEMIDGERRLIYPGYFVPSLKEELNGGEWSFMYTCTDNCAGLKAHLLVNGIHRKHDSDILENEDPAPVPAMQDEPEIQVFTTAIDGMIVDLNRTKDLYSPFIIFARVHLQNRPVAGLQVQAYIIPTTGGEDPPTSINTHVVVQLVDDGLGYPDIEPEDGIYSGIFVPDVDGSYRITVQIRNSANNTDSAGHDQQLLSIVAQNGGMRLLPIDQTQFGCSSDEDPEVDRKCGAVKLDKLYQVSYDAINTISFVNRNEFVHGKPCRILELDIPQTSCGEIVLTFITPCLMGTTHTVHIGYNIYIAKEKHHILDHRNNRTLVDFQLIHSTKQPSDPDPEQLHLRSYRYHGIIWIGIEVFNVNDTAHGVSDISIVKNTNLLDPITNSPEPADPPPSTSTPESSEPTDEPPSSTSEEPAASSSTESNTESKSFWKKTEGIIIIVVIIVVGVAVLGGGVWYCKKRYHSTDMSTA